MPNVRFQSVQISTHLEKHHYQEDETRCLHVFAIATDGSLWCCEWEVDKHTQTPWMRMEDLPEI